MSRRETYKDVEVSGRKWRVKKFDALTGSYIVYKLLFQMLPMALDSQVMGEMSDIQALLPQRSTMSKSEFSEIQIECLLVCFELTVIGDKEVPIPIINPQGKWLVEGAETDVALVMALTVHTLVFNISSFFDDDALKELKEKFKVLSPFGASI